jgi:hypothetical protein
MNGKDKGLVLLVGWLVGGEGCAVCVCASNVGNVCVRDG